MFKPIASVMPQAGAPIPGPDDSGIKRVFMVLHGFYGNLFLSKFATGNVTERGEDEGIANARRVWAHGLRDFDVDTVKTALSRCQTAHPEFPPNLPQFLQLCMANRPRETFKPGHPALTMSAELRSTYTEKARARIEELREESLRLKTGYIELPQTLDGLKRAVANAVACAGGDEASTLRRLDLMLAAKAPA